MCSTSDPDKDIDSVTGPGLDVESCHRAFQHLAKVWTLMLKLYFFYYQRQIIHLVFYVKKKQSRLAFKVIAF